MESESHSVVSSSLRSHGLYTTWNSLGQNTGVGGLSLLQEIFPTQGSNPGLPYCRQILYYLSHHRSPLITMGLCLIPAFSTGHNGYHQKKKKNPQTDAGEDEEAGEPSCPVEGNVNWYSPVQNSMDVP